jgi:hypothetical protein
MDEELKVRFLIFCSRVSWYWRKVDGERELGRID